MTLGNANSVNPMMVSGGNNLNFRNTNANKQLNFDHNGTFNIRHHDGTTVTTLITVDTSGNMGFGTASPGAKVEVDVGSSGTKGGVVKAASSQTANLLEIQDSSGNVQSTFNKDGYFTTRRTTEPANADLANSEMVIWLQSDGKAVWFKAKDNAGTPVVRKGSITLS